MSVEKRYVIYCYTNQKNGKQYIGQTKQPDERKGQHRRLAKRGGKKASLLHEAMQQDGYDNFVYEELEECSSPEKLTERETFYIQAFNTLWPNGYNLYMQPNVYTEEYCRFISEALKGREFTENHRKNISQGNMGVSRHRTSEHNAKIGKSHLNLKHTDKTKQILSKHFSTIDYIVTFPDGHEEIIRNLKKFSVEHGLEQSNLMHVVKGRKKSSKGYKVRYLDGTTPNPWRKGCEYCGISFEAKLKNQRFCSPKCRSIDNNRRAYIKEKEKKIITIKC